MVLPGHDWFLREWLRAAGKKQADIVKDLDWNKSKISLMVNGKQAYTREEVNELATYLNISPHELLMHPEDAMALRQLRASARQIVRVPFGGTAGDESEQEDGRKVA
jgi:plasmid maintenance system antidote protein VapI